MLVYLDLVRGTALSGAVVVGTGRIDEPRLQVSQHRCKTVTLQDGQSSLEHASDGDTDCGSIWDHPTNRPQHSPGLFPKNSLDTLQQQIPCEDVLI